MATGKFISYLRVSTDKQGRSGLGLEAQREAVESHLNGGNWSVIKEYVEVESGKNDARPQLHAALHHAKVTGATLLIAKLDRLSRDVAFIANLQKAASNGKSVKFVCCDMPDANELTIHLFAAIAQHERKLISQRTKAAMAAAKAKGRVFGNPNGARALQGLGNAQAVASIRKGADDWVEFIMPVIEDIKATGITTLAGIAAELNARGIVTRRGGKWHPTTVKNLVERPGR